MRPTKAPPPTSGMARQIRHEPVLRDSPRRAHREAFMGEGLIVVQGEKRIADYGKPLRSSFESLRTNGAVTEFTEVFRSC
ncbi:MAG: hypothetical protein P0120_04875 [Nitrospira sp.]|nr:hypothetical protein [Nitrospira sp.]